MIHYCFQTFPRNVETWFILEKQVIGTWKILLITCNGVNVLKWNTSSRIIIQSRDISNRHEIKILDRFKIKRILGSIDT